MRTEEELRKELERLDRIDEEMCKEAIEKGQDAVMLEDAISYIARREAILWVLGENNEC